MLQCFQKENQVLQDGTENNGLRRVGDAFLSFYLFKKLYFATWARANESCTYTGELRGWMLHVLYCQPVVLRSNPRANIGMTFHPSLHRLAALPISLY